MYRWNSPEHAVTSVTCVMAEPSGRHVNSWKPIAKELKMSLHDFNPAYFTTEEIRSVFVVTVTRTRLCEEDNIEQFGVELNQLVDHFSCHWLAIDLSQVTLITSAAVGKLIGLHRNLHRRGGRLVLCGIAGITQTVFESARLIDYFHVTSSVDEAIEQLIKAKSTSSS